ncbi:TetR/AcrR family transcriptional regulator [Kribbella sp. CA-253562]|uniref:TetR/AcrR family transcriptional regulator n=1 Tax=Kribbella sp. CA-253562 TaxID=3239942 RepID=UPI003D8E51D4
MTTTKRRVLDAAIDLLGTEGLRALTHGRVDERAGVAKGSTSNYFRTREALITGVAEWIAQYEMPGVEHATQPRTVDEFVDAVCALVEVTTTGAHRTLTAARLVLFLEANHNDDIRRVITAGRATMESAVVVSLAGLGAKDPQIAARAIMACCEGINLHRIARHDTTDARPLLEMVIRAALPTAVDAKPPSAG